MSAATGASGLRLERGTPRRTAGATVRWILDPPAPGAWNMAADVALARCARHGAAIRLYGWQPACLSFGRHQRALAGYDPERLRDLGIDVVRRPTGGAAVWHEDELTYAVALPARLWGGPRSTFRLVHAAILRALRTLGVRARAARAPASAAHAAACFAVPAPGEIVVAGRKLVGSAQARIGRALLQHGSILLGGGQEIAESGGARSLVARAAPATLESVLAPRPEHNALVAALAAGFGSVLGCELRVAAWTEEERAHATREVERFLDPAWTWRR